MEEIPSMNGTFITGTLGQIQVKDDACLHPGQARHSQIRGHQEEQLKSQLEGNLVQIKEENKIDVESEFTNPELEFNAIQQVVTTATNAKVNPGQIIQGGVIPITSHISYTTASDVLCATSSSTSKSLSGQTALMPVTIQPSSLTVPDLEPGTIYSSSGSIVASSASSGSLTNPVQMFQASSFDNCETVLNQQQGGQAFLLAPSGTVISSPIVSQGQVYIQGDNLVGVPLSSSSSQYTATTSESQFGNNIPFIQTNSQGATNAVPARIIIQTNQPNATTLSQPLLASNNSHYLIQVGNNYPVSSQGNNFSVNNKGHIVIKSGGNKVKTEPQDLSSQPVKDGIFRVVIPEGTTKITRPTHPVTNVGTVESLKKYVQINVSNTPVRALQTKLNQDNVETQTIGNVLPSTVAPEKNKPQSARRLYECTICNSKFMRPLYLRMHMRSCKKPEVKVEKTPLFMCSFCKSTFKSKQQINYHFTNCSHNPYNESKVQLNKDELEGPPQKKEKLTRIDSSLEQAVQYKCQDCDRTFSKERQYTSHIKRCTKVSVHDLSGAKVEVGGEEHHEEENDMQEDPFADPPVSVVPPKRGRGAGGRRGRPPGKISAAAKIAGTKTNSLFEGDKLSSISNGLVVADNENLVRSTTGLAHTVQLSLDMASQEGTAPSALVADSKGVRGRGKPPQAWSLVCSLCQKMFLTKAALASHVISNHGSELHSTRNVLFGKTDEKDSYRCPLCLHHYNTSDGFIEHLVLQHTLKLQECYNNLQAQTGSFVCSLCSLVLLTKTLLLEHLSLEHLDELESCVQVQRQQQRKSSAVYSHPNVKTKLDLEVEEEDYSTPALACSNSSTTTSHSAQNNWDPSLADVKVKPNGETALECSFCGDDLATQEELVHHYTEVHGVETDTDGSLLDLGIDVDIKVKDTQSLIHMANGKVDEKSSNLPDKTVLIRKKPKQNWQCQNCLQVFSRQSSYMKHVRELCGAQESTRVPSSRENNFFCPERECSHLAFYQVKSLFKHMEEVHGIAVRRERKSFKQLMFFYQWLEQEERTGNVKFVKENAKYERNNIKLIQMVCQKFHSARMEQAKEKEAELSKPTKKRWSVRLQRSSNCLARIHLRVEYSDITNEYDGETQMIYYPEHSHSEEEENSDAIDKMMVRHPKNRALVKNNGVMNRAENESLNLDPDSLESGHGGPLANPQEVEPLAFAANEVVSLAENSTSQIAQYVSLATDSVQGAISQDVSSQSPPNISLQEKLGPKKKGRLVNASSPIILQPLDSSSISTSSVILSGSSVSISQPNPILPSESPTNSLIVGTNETKLVLPSEAESRGLVQNDMISTSSPSTSRVAKSSLVDSSGVSSFVFQESDIVMDMGHGDPTVRESTNSSGLQQEEYILPADESEWIKLFDVLRARMNASELTEDEKKEAEAVINYQGVISMMALPEQVSIFQKLCALTNTSLESV